MEETVSPRRPDLLFQHGFVPDTATTPEHLTQITGRASTRCSIGEGASCSPEATAICCAAAWTENGGTRPFPVTAILSARQRVDQVP